MKMHEQYLEVLKTFDDYVTIREWSEKFKEIYPDDYKIIEEQAKKQKTKTNGFRELNKKIATSTNKTKSWLNIVSEKKDSKPKKYKYLHEEEREDKDVEKKDEDEKFVNFKLLMADLTSLNDDFELPHRDDSIYTGDEETKGIEQVEIYEFNAFIMFEMATRNKDVIEIINKLKYIKELKDRYPYLEYDIGIIFQDTPNIKEIQNEYIDIARLSLSDFQRELEFLVDIKYSDNYNEHYVDDMEEKGIFLEDHDLDDHQIDQFKFKNIKDKVSVDSKYLTFIKLNIIIDYLESKLKNEYFIYPNGYYEHINYRYRDKINKDTSINEDLLNRDILNEINETLNDFRTLNPKNIKQISDLFFMYDYNKKRRLDENKNFITEDIKVELTMYHGIEIEGLKNKIFTYEDCLERYEDFKDKKAKFHIGERSISNKLKLVKIFIDDEYYKCIIFK